MSCLREEGNSLSMPLPPKVAPQKCMSPGGNAHVHATKRHKNKRKHMFCGGKVPERTGRHRSASVPREFSPPSHASKDEACMQKKKKEN